MTGPADGEGLGESPDGMGDAGDDGEGDIDYGDLDAAEDEQSRVVVGIERGRLKIAERAPDWMAGLDWKTKNTLAPTVGNAALILQRAEEWNGLRYDEFRSEPICSGAPRVAGFDRPKDGPLDDYSITHMAQWLGLRWRLRVGPLTMGAAALVASKGKGRAFHPVRDYLRALQWDGVKRIDTWLSRYAGAAASDYVSAIGRMWLIAAVARVMRPGSICKTMIILEGKQDAGKSTLLRRLCPEESWFSDTPIDLSNKDAYQVLRGKWIGEIPELDGFRGKDSTRIKSFVSSPSDNYRKSFGKTNEDVPRQCVFAGTTNEEHYFHDSTGNVRFWPFRVGARVDFDSVERDRDQLWAEAYEMYVDNHPWHITDRRISDMAKAEQAEREEEDVWAAKVAEWIASPLGLADARRGVTTSAVLSALGVVVKDQGRGEQTRIGTLLKKFGLVRAPGTERPRKYILRDEESEE